MVFSSLIFLYFFLPIAILGYYVLGRKARNGWLLLISLVFFAWGGVSYTLLLMGSILLNYFFGLQIQKEQSQISAKNWFVVGITVNILLLVVFKYATFMVSNTNFILNCLKILPLRDPGIALPIGISFYTFHAISYLVDIYKKKTHAQKNIVDMALYISMFSQLIAGPIIRYGDVSQQLRARRESLDKFSMGIERFILGLAKKILIANVLGKVADASFNTDVSSLNSVNAWIGLICYSMQIYYDFSGYSDMAIGLGKMFGFEFQENFNFPYCSGSLREFWQRWHISLSTFFRDYVYIPLGGNRSQPWRVYLNLGIVFLLTGMWHGASWAFVVWGALNGIVLIIERIGFQKLLEKSWPPLSNLYLILVIMLLWVPFRTESLTEAIAYWNALFRFQMTDTQAHFLLSNVDMEIIVTLCAAIGGAFGVFAKLNNFLRYLSRSVHSLGRVFSLTVDTTASLVNILILIYCTIHLVGSTYNPFIYYKF